MDDGVRMRIIQEAYDLFNTRGYRNVTIQDLAENLGMSKKTIYLYFSGKEEIASSVVVGMLERMYQSISESADPQTNPLRVLKETLYYVKNEMNRMGPLFLEDIVKYLPDLKCRIDQFRNEFKNFIEELLEEAHRQGLTKDIPPHLATIIFMKSLQSLSEDVNFLAQHGYSRMDIFEAFVSIFCSGIEKMNEDSNNREGS